MKIHSLEQTEPGQVLCFRYHGGSKPGTFRNVEVIEVNRDHLVGTDLGKDAVRMYTRSKIGLPIEVIVDVAEAPEPRPRMKATTVSFVEARDRLTEQIDQLSGEDLAELLAEVEGVERGLYNPCTGKVTLEQVVTGPECHLVYNVDQEGHCGIEWVNTDGDSLVTIALTDDHDHRDSPLVQLYVADQAVTPEEFIQELSQHLGLTQS